jgi:hypothetical protein
VTNYLHIEGGNYGGAAGFIGDFELSDSSFHFQNGTQTLLTGITGWLVGYNDGNSDPNSPQPWVQVGGTTIADIGVNGVGPWGFRGGISASAHWIWPDDPQSLPNGNFCQNCTVDFSAAMIPATGVPEPAMWLPLGVVLAGLLTRLVQGRS